MDADNAEYYEKAEKHKNILKGSMITQWKRPDEGDVAVHSEAEGCEAERETGRFEHRGLSAWTPNPEGSA
jgi:hypothetical protein